MSIADLKNVLRIFAGSDIDAGAQQELYKEVLLMVLARASSSDANIQAIEVESILAIIKNETGDEVSEQDVRRAGRTELYETTPLDKYLGSARKKLADEDRVKIIHLLADIIKSDTTVSVLEVDFFNMVADALRISPAEIAGLTP